METTLILVKPDGVQRQLIGVVINRIEQSGLKIVGLKLMKLDMSRAEQHYSEHTDKPFFSELVDFITSSPLVALAVNGPNAVNCMRKLIGGLESATDPQKAQQGTIRGDYGVTISKNIIHGSATVKDAERELKIFFNSSDIIDYERDIDKWIL